jgi:serine/threonine protein kinase
LFFLIWFVSSQEAVDFIDRLLVVDKTKRMTSSEALAHPWLAKRNFPAAKLNISGNLKKHVALRSSSTAAFTASFDL